MQSQIRTWTSYVHLSKKKTNLRVLLVHVWLKIRRKNPPLSPKIIAGQCRTNPWPTVPDCLWGRNADAGLTLLTDWRNADAGLTFSGMPSSHVAVLAPKAAVYGRPRCIPFHRLYFKGGRGLTLHVQSWFNAGMPDCPAVGQSGTGTNNNANAGTSPVPK